MLVVNRKVGERIVLTGGIEITVVSVARGAVRLAVTAPKDVHIARGELHDAIASSNARAAATHASLFGPPRESPAPAPSQRTDNTIGEEQPR